MEKIGVFFGSRSPEHDVSIITAQLIISALKGMNKEVVPVYLSKKGEWYVGDEMGEIGFFTREGVEDRLENLGGYFLDLSIVGKMRLVKTGLFKKLIDIDLAFPSFHGLNGEDGTAQGLFELIGLPYVGCDVAASALTMDKVLTKMIYRSAGFPTVEFVYFTGHEWKANQTDILVECQGKLGWPLIIKPARLGSSIGITKVKDRDSLLQAIEVALHYDDKVIVERCIEDLMDITCAVLGDGENIVSSLIQESTFASELFTYEEKYLKEGGSQLGKAESKIIIPARLDVKTTDEIRQMSAQIFKLFGCAGIARVDFLYDRANNKYYANEINTLPGTLYHHLWKKSGVSLEELLSELIDLAKKRQINKAKITSVFESSILQKMKGSKVKAGN
ncbi:MAG: D-alanine--D-alanine ligase family protein [Patescibacteria group bacterium]